MTENWRGIVAALLNPDLRAALAELSSGPGLTPARRERAISRLEGVGLVVRDDAGAARFDDAGLRDLLATSAVPRASGPQRYLDADGRIDRYPARADDRRALLEWVADRALPAGDVLTEPQLNERLASFADDVALLRRHLVDHGMVDRTRSGSEYARVSSIAE